MIASVDLSPFVFGWSTRRACLTHRLGRVQTRQQKFAYHEADAGVAQLVEQRICNAWAVGSSPTSGFRYDPSGVLGRRLMTDR